MIPPVKGARGMSKIKVVMFYDSPFQGDKGDSRQLNGIVFMMGIEKISPPFKGGVAGMLDYLMFTKFNSRPGWLISLSVQLIPFI
jgi:hypothetical protein